MPNAAPGSPARLRPHAAWDAFIRHDAIWGEISCSGSWGWYGLRSADDKRLLWPPSPGSAPRHCLGPCSPPQLACSLGLLVSTRHAVLCPARPPSGAWARCGWRRASPTLPRWENGGDGRFQRWERTELPGESCPGCSCLFSAWARPGNVRKIKNKYLGNEARDGAGWQRAEPRTVAGGG